MSEQRPTCPVCGQPLVAFPGFPVFPGEPCSLECMAIELARQDCQQWANLPESAREHYREAARTA